MLYIYHILQYDRIIPQIVPESDGQMHVAGQSSDHERGLTNMTLAKIKTGAADFAQVGREVWAIESDTALQQHG